MNKEDFYDIEVDEDEVLQKSCVGDIFYLKELKQRKLYLTDDISPYSVADTVRHILQFNAEDVGIEPAGRKPITLYIASIGGDVDPGFELIDVIRASKTPVHIVCMGYCYSMGFLILIAGHKRYALKNAKFLMHDGSDCAYGSTSKVKDRILFNDRFEERIKDYVLKQTSITSEQYDDNRRVEWYMFADEAKANGVIDSIIGEDCEIDEVV